MKSKVLILTVIAIIAIIVLAFKKGEVGLTLPNLTNPPKQTEEVPIATPDAPKTYNFDSSSDLKEELDSVNPQILDSDFE